MKTCKKCHKELDLQHFVKNKNCKDGYEGTCKECKNAERRLRYKTLIKNDNSSGTKICKRCNGEFLYSEFSIDLKAKDGHRNICKSCDRERIRARRDFNKKQKNSTWWNKKANSINKRGRKNLSDKVSGVELSDLYDHQNGKCAYCGIELGTKFHIDHKLPISRGGKNTIQNIALCCKDCNLLKWERTDNEFLEFLIEYAKRIQYSLIRTEG